MGRAARIDVAGGIHHISTRGIRTHAIFVDDDDRHLFLRILARAVRRHRWHCLSYCLMTTHYHLLVETPEDNLSVGMHLLNGTYARIFNETHGHGGHLFRRRFGSAFIESEYHLFAAMRYVVLNPVRAGLCSHPAEWRWSSYRASMGLAPRPSFLAVERLLAHFGRDVATARAAYEEFVLDGLPAMAA